MIKQVADKQSVVSPLQFKKCPIVPLEASKSRLTEEIGERKGMADMSGMPSMINNSSVWHKQLTVRIFFEESPKSE